MLKQVLLFIALLIGFFLFYTTLTYDGHDDLVGKPAPNFTTQNLDKEYFTLEHYKGSKVILLNFWATWCGPCREEIPVLNAIYNEVDSDDFLLIAISEDEAPNMAQFLSLIHI